MNENLNILFIFLYYFKIIKYEVKYLFLIKLSNLDNYDVL